MVSTKILFCQISIMVEINVPVLRRLISHHYKCSILVIGYKITCVPVLSLEQSGINVFVFNYSSANEFFPKGQGE